MAQGRGPRRQRRTHKGGRKILPSVLQHGQQKKKIQTGATLIPPRRKMFFAFLFARGHRGLFHPRQAGCPGIWEYISRPRERHKPTITGTRAGGRPPPDIVATTPTHKTTGRSTTQPPTSAPRRYKPSNKASTDFFPHTSANDTRCIVVCAQPGGPGLAWSKAVAPVDKGGATKGKEKFCFPSRNTNNRKKKSTPAQHRFCPEGKCFSHFFFRGATMAFFTPGRGG